MKDYRVPVIVSMTCLAAASRLIPHPPNFTPITAVALFAAATLTPRWAAFATTLGAMLLGDLALELTTRFGLLSGWLARGHGFHQGMLAIYAIFLLITAIGLLLRERRGVAAVGGATLAGSLLFFLLSNLVVWADGVLYPTTLAGLGQCYVAALPFLKWTILGDAFFVAVLFGGLALLERVAPDWVIRSRPTPAVVPVTSA